MTTRWVHHRKIISKPLKYHKYTIRRRHQNIPWSHHENTMSTAWVQHECIMSMNWLHNDNIIITLWIHREYTMGTPWDYHQNAMSTLWLHNDYAIITLLVHHEQLEYRFWVSCPEYLGESSNLFGWIDQKVGWVVQKIGWIVQKIGWVVPENFGWVGFGWVGFWVSCPAPLSIAWEHHQYTINLQ